MNQTDRVAAVIPAAGIGARMQLEQPKQYLALAGLTVLEWSVQAMRMDPRIEHVFIALAEDDPFFAQLPLASDVNITTVIGGATRAGSVLAASHAAQQAGFNWVAVHDAARPCLHVQELGEVLDVALSDEVGALLALPAADTLKQSLHQRAQQTLDRAQVWQALTPQVFRTAQLINGITEMGVDHAMLTDESSVFEAQQKFPRLVVGRRSNLKITQPGDEAIALALLQSMKSGR